MLFFGLCAQCQCTMVFLLKLHLLKRPSHAWPCEEKSETASHGHCGWFLYVCQRFCIELVSENYTYVDSISNIIFIFISLHLISMHDSVFIKFLLIIQIKYLFTECTPWDHSTYFYLHFLPNRNPQNEKRFMHSVRF